MKIKYFQVLFAYFIFPSALFAQQAQSNTLLLFYLGGQSNMDGFGYTADLPAALNKPLENVWIFTGSSAADEVNGGGMGKWEALQPGHGTGFWSDGLVNHHSDRFGVELSFAARLRELYPGKKIALIKYSRGGTSIDSLAAGNFGCWEPDFHGKTGINQYDHFLATVRNAKSVSDITGDGKADYLVPCGIIWMQGESDGFWDKDIALRYYANLKRLMDLIRAAMLVDDLPVVIGKISDSGQDDDGKVWNVGDIVQAAQEKYAATDGHAAIVRSTSGYKFSDPYHYTSDAYIDLGRKFAESVSGLMNNQ